MIEVLKQALDALETEVSIDWTNNDEFNASAEKMHDAITSLRQVIAELESQEPVAIYMGHRITPAGSKEFWGFADLPLIRGTKLYTHPPQRTWVELTDEERSQLVTLHHGWNEYAQAIEAKLREKNT
jgi:hypothetical protein